MSVLGNDATASGNLKRCWRPGRPIAHLACRVRRRCWGVESTSARHATDQAISAPDPITGRPWIASTPPVMCGEAARSSSSQPQAMPSPVSLQSATESSRRRKRSRAAKRSDHRTARPGAMPRPRSSCVSGEALGLTDLLRAFSRVCRSLRECRVPCLRRPCRPGIRESRRPRSRPGGSVHRRGR